VILSGNEVFRRVAGFASIEEMIGKPQNIIRHPDMPRAVFKLLWTYIQSNKTMCAYVKNLAKDGSYYWVFAVILPIDNGYLSVRFKPSSPIFIAVKEIYKSMLSIEREAGNDPGSREVGMRLAGDRLMVALNELGYPDYDTFMRTALATEMGARAKAIRTASHQRLVQGSNTELLRALEMCVRFDETLDRMFMQVETFLNLNARLEARSGFLSTLAGDVSLLALNSLVSCHKHGLDGRSLAVVAEDLSRISKESMVCIAELKKGITELVDSLRLATFHICTSKLQIGTSMAFLAELIQSTTGTSGQRQFSDLRVLSASFAISIGEVKDSLPSLIAPISSLTTGLDDLSKTMRALSLVRLTGLIEAAHIHGAETVKQLFSDVAIQLNAAKSEVEGFTEELRLLRQSLPSLAGDSSALSADIESFHLEAA
jgi:aerotaxis receptor